MSRPIRWLGVVLEPLLITIPSQDKHKIIEHFYQLFLSIDWLSQGKFSCRKIFHFREIGRLFKREKPAIKWLTSLFLSWLMKWSQSIICLFCAWFVCLFFSTLGFVCFFVNILTSIDLCHLKFVYILSLHVCTISQRPSVQGLLQHYCMCKFSRGPWKIVKWGYSKRQQWFTAIK